MIFRRAILWLTVGYTALQLLLFGVFAVAVYSFVTGTFDFDAVEPEDEHIAELGFAALRQGLLLAFAALLVLAPLFGYLMARSALKPVRAGYELQQRFVDGVSHELRTPLSVLQGELELALTRERSPEEYQAAIARSLAAVDGLTRLTDDLLLLTQGSGRRLDAAFRPLDVNELVEEAVHARAGAAPVEVRLGPLFAVRGSPELLAQAVGNLIDNAVKFSPPGTPIRVSTAVAGPTGMIAVRDQGPGMSQDETRHAFDRFWRADAARSTPGHGLGLSLVREICAAHGGDVRLFSSPGSGTTARMTLPLLPEGSAVAAEGMDSGGRPL
ncbi:cell wall metabolism sensor histidine kinase WalK [Naasia sp. SYSU D00057]|uniref:sensor histidine kinase n=1 Tax=Naasia sp. SYSU D00057 TaxID=2817380 RepID=UPI001B30D71A|nr:HAMP domain-containing sensor histidine kinase [Naasia sp. SYSU D00057]